MRNCFRKLAATEIALLLLSFPGQAPAQSTAIQFDTIARETIEKRLHRVSDKNRDRETNLKQLFEEAGCADENLVEQPIGRRRIPNVVCSLRGTSDKQFIVGAHFDHVSLGKGVVDNWSGAALLPSIYETLRKQSLKHTFVFIGFSEEEAGLVGSAVYARHMSEHEVARTRVMVNFDCLGLGPTKIWLNHSDPGLADNLKKVALAMKLSLEAVNADKVGNDDSRSFSHRKIPTVMIHSITQETLPVLHTVRDNFEAIRLDDYYDTYRLMVAYLLYLDRTLIE